MFGLGLLSSKGSERSSIRVHMRSLFMNFMTGGARIHNLVLRIVLWAG